MNKEKFKFKGKYIIEADLRCLTGLLIGGTIEGIEIGGIYNPVIRDPLTDYPYIPGSALKGKLRSLLEWVVKKENGKTPVEDQIDKFNKDKEKREEKLKNQGNSDKEIKKEIDKMKPSVLPCKCGKCDVCIVFGSAAEAPSEGPTRLTVRDAFPTEKNQKESEDQSEFEDTIEKWQKWLGEGIYTELKTENVIDRITSEAMPRTMERIPKGSVFNIEMIYDIYKTSDKTKLKNIFLAMALLEDSTLGGSGTRGYGKVKFENFKAEFRPISYYEKKEKSKPVNFGDYKTTKEIVDNFESINF